MPDSIRFTILGCGSSPGVPRITGDWGNCDPENPKNRRRRASALVQRFGPSGVTTVVIDTGPDFRDQMLMAGAKRLDGAVFTHAHADHIHGIDDLRGYVLEQRRLMDVYADAATAGRLMDGFRYCFETPIGSQYPPILNLVSIDAGAAFEVTGEGGSILFEPLLQIHGEIHSLGFRIGGLAYCADVSGFPADTVPRLTGLDWLIVDALQYRTHPSHFSLGEALEWVDRLQPHRAILTHMHIPLDYDTVMRETPDHVEPAYDGMTIELPC